MNFKKSIFILSVFLMAGGANAEVKECSFYNQIVDEDGKRGLQHKDVPVGTECIVVDKGGTIIGTHRRATLTLKDGTRVKGIEIVGTGIIMEDAIRSNLCQTDTITYSDGSKLRLDDCFDTNGNSLGAEQYCEARGLSLPTIEEFITLDTRGFREAFAGDTANKYFWSSSVYPNIDDLAYVFNGYYGQVNSGYRDGRDYNLGSARCVGAAGVNR